MEILPLVIDGILILIFAACIIDGRRKGLVKMILSLVSVIISFAVAQSISAPVAAWANEAFVGEAVSGYVEEYIGDAFENGASLNKDYPDVQSIEENLPEEIKSLLEKYGVSIESITDDAADSIEQVSKNIADKILDAVLLPVLETVAFLAVYIICSAVLSIISGIICSVFKLPVINRINKILGGILGAVKGFCVVTVVSMLAVLVCGFIQGNEVADAVTQSTLANALSDAATQLISSI